MAIERRWFGKYTCIQRARKTLATVQINKLTNIDFSYPPTWLNELLGIFILAALHIMYNVWLFEDGGCHSSLASVEEISHKWSKIFTSLHEPANFLDSEIVKQPRCFLGSIKWRGAGFMWKPAENIYRYHRMLLSTYRPRSYYLLSFSCEGNASWIRSSNFWYIRRSATLRCIFLSYNPDNERIDSKSSNTHL